METFPEGRAVVYCQGAFNTPNGKTAHGLVRRTERYQILSVVDARFDGGDAGLILDGRQNGVKVFAGLPAAVAAASADGRPATHCVMGLAPDGGRLSAEARRDMLTALELGLNVDSGLHDLLSEDPELVAAAERAGVRIRDVRKTPPRRSLHFFSGRIEEVASLKVALLGTDSAVGKRTTAWILIDALRAAGYRCELIGTGQTAWMQGVRYGLIMDAVINDFVAGEIEHAVLSAWDEVRPDVIVIEGQGSLMNPAYPGGLEILAAGRPDVVVLQHAPARKEYDGFPGYPIHPLKTQIQAVELLSSRPVAAVTLNREGLDEAGIQAAIETVNRETGLPAMEVLYHRPEPLLAALRPYLRKV